MSVRQVGTHFVIVVLQRGEDEELHVEADLDQCVSGVNIGNTDVKHAFFKIPKDMNSFRVDLLLSVDHVVDIDRAKLMLASSEI